MCARVGECGGRFYIWITYSAVHTRARTNTDTMSARKALYTCSTAYKLEIFDGGSGGGAAAAAASSSSFAKVISRRVESARRAFILAPRSIALMKCEAVI